MLGDDVGGVGHHVAPAGVGILHAEAQEAQPGFGDQRGTGEQRGLHDDRSGDARQDVAAQDLGLGQPGHAGRGQIQLGADADGRAARHTHDAGRAEDAEGDHGCGLVLGEDCQHDQQDDDDRNGQHDIGQAHNHRVNPAAAIAGDQPRRYPDDHDRGEGFAGAEQTDPATVEQPAEHVAAEVVGAEPMPPAGQGEDVVQVLLEGTVGREQPGCEYRHDEKEQEHRSRGRYRSACHSTQYDEPGGWSARMAWCRGHRARTFGLSQP